MKELILIAIALLRRVLENQIDMLVWQMEPKCGNPEATKKSVKDTVVLLQKTEGKEGA